LWSVRRGTEIGDAIVALVRELAGRAEEQMEVIIPAYTHLQRAMPVRVSHQLLGYAQALRRQLFFLGFHVKWWAGYLPIGSGACSGNSFEVDAGEIGDAYKAVIGDDDEWLSVENSMDGVSNRDFALDLVYACAKCMTHLSR